MIIFLSLCAVGVGGFLYGRFTAPTQDTQQIKLNLSKNYFVGLNYLLTEQNDKALTLLIKSLSVDSDTIETHLALGSLFRRRGELSRAIRIHQNLIARPNLSSTEKHQAMLALAYDYLAAGMLDRAEHSFWAVAEDPLYRTEALHKLMDIYQRERRWLQAIEVGQQLLASGEKALYPTLAHFHCERAELFLKQHQPDAALQELTQAKKCQRRLARIYLLMGQAYQHQGAHAKALSAYQTVAEVDRDYLAEALPKMIEVHQQVASLPALTTYLEQLQSKWPCVSTTVALAQHYAQHQGLHRAIAFLEQAIAHQPSLKVMLQWIEFEQQLPLEPAIHQQMLTLQQIASQLLQHKPIYRCQHCGFAGRILFWQCPGCKHWNSIKPIDRMDQDEAHH